MVFERFRPCALQCVLQKICVFIASKTHRSIRVYTTVLMRFLLSLELHVELCGHAANTRSLDIFGHRFHFDALSTVFDRSH